MVRDCIQSLHFYYSLLYKASLSCLPSKTNENSLKTLSFNDKDKIKGKVNSTRINFLV